MLIPDFHVTSANGARRGAEQENDDVLIFHQRMSWKMLEFEGETARGTPSSFEGDKCAGTNGIKLSRRENYDCYN